jgi:hypothetical protein
MFPLYQIDKPRAKTAQVLEPSDPPEQKIDIAPIQEESKGEDWMESWIMPPINPSGQILRTAVPNSHWEVLDDKEERGVLRSSHSHQEFVESPSISKSTSSSKSKAGQSKHAASVELGLPPVKNGKPHRDKSGKRRSAKKAPTADFGSPRVGPKSTSDDGSRSKASFRIESDIEDPELGEFQFESKSTSEKSGPSHFGSKSISSDKDSKSVFSYKKLFQDPKKHEANTRNDPSEHRIRFSSEDSSSEDSSSDEESGSDDAFLDEYQEEGRCSPSYTTLMVLLFVNSVIASFIGVFIYVAAKNKKNDASDNIFRET